VLMCPPRRKLNESPSKVEDPAVLKLPLCTPKIKKITLHFPLGLEVVARNMKGVTIKDALDAIHKQFKKRVCILLPICAAEECSPALCGTCAFFELQATNHTLTHCLGRR
jgi:hypothetical protein